MEAKLNKKQKDAIKKYLEFTCTKNKKMAQNILKDVNWNVEQAVEVFYVNYGGQEEQEVEAVASKPKEKASVNKSNIRGTPFSLPSFNII
jgi:hypothetical protein